MLAGDVGAVGVEEVLPILHVQHAVARIVALVVTGGYAQYATAPAARLASSAPP